MEAGKNFVRNQIAKDGGIPEVFPINQHIAMKLIDLKTNTVANVVQSSNKSISTCGGDLPDYADLKQYMRIFQCGGNIGYNIQWEYKISWNNNIVLVNPNNPNNKTKGRLKIVNAANITQVDFTTYNVNIQNLGIDPVNPINNIYSVKFIVNNIIPSNLINTNTGAGPYTLRLSQTFATDCPSLENYAMVPQDPSGFGTALGNTSDPCNRVDKVYFQGVSGNTIGICGPDVVGGGCYNSEFPRPSLSEVNFSKDGGATWNDFSNYTANSNFGIYHTSFIRFSDFASAPLSSGTYNIVIRYRNWNYKKLLSTYPLPVTSSLDCYTYGASIPVNSDNTYTYEYYNNLIIP